MAILNPVSPGNRVESSQFSNWVQGINMVRSKQGYGGFPTTPPGGNIAALSQQMQTIQSYLDQTRALPRISRVYSRTILPSIGVNNPITASTITLLDQTIQNYYNVCAVDVVNGTCGSTNSTNPTNGTCGRTNNTNGNCSTCGSTLTSYGSTNSTRGTSNSTRGGGGGGGCMIS